MVQLRDIDIRSAVKARLLAHALSCQDTRVVEESGLSHGAARVDIAVIDGHIRAMRWVDFRVRLSPIVALSTLLRWLLQVGTSVAQ